MKAFTLTLWKTCVLLAILGAISNARGSFDMFLKIDTIEGETTVVGHTNEISVVSFNYSLSKSNGTSQPKLNDLVVVKTVDKATPQLFLKCCTGTHIPKATLSVRKAGTTAPDYYQIELTDVLITSVSNSGSGASSDDRPTESISFNYGQIKWTYIRQDAVGNPIEPPVVTTFGTGPVP